MTLEVVAPGFTFAEWTLVCGFVSTAFFFQLTRVKPPFHKAMEVIALVAGSIFTLVNSPWFFGLALVLMCLAMIIRIKYRLDTEPSTTSPNPVQGVSDS